MIIMIDGIDGSGKSTIMHAWAGYLEKQGKHVFRLKEYWAKHAKHPDPAELVDYDVIISAEPTTIEIGAKIRQEMIRPDTSYTSLQIAEAYAEDRRLLYEHVLIPVIKEKKIILQDRGISTSLCYQPLLDAELTVEKILAFPGNQLAMAHAPNHLVLVDVSADTALQRLRGRTEKQDQAMFEREEFLKKARARFLDPGYQQYFTKRGTHVHTLSATADIAIIRQTAIALIQTFIY